MFALQVLIVWRLVRATGARLSPGVRSVLVLPLAAVVWLGPLGVADAAQWRKCSGIVKLPYGEQAREISVRRVGCGEARRAIKAPASKLGYQCTDPFDDPQGSGGWVTCRKGKRAIRFLYVQS